MRQCGATALFIFPHVVLQQNAVGLPWFDCAHMLADEQPDQQKCVMVCVWLRNSLLCLWTVDWGQCVSSKA